MWVYKTTISSREILANRNIQTVKSIFGSTPGITGVHMCGTTTTTTEAAATTTTAKTMATTTSYEWMSNFGMKNWLNSLLCNRLYTIHWKQLWSCVTEEIFLMRLLKKQRVKTNFSGPRHHLSKPETGFFFVMFSLWQLIIYRYDLDQPKLEGIFGDH